MVTLQTINLMQTKQACFIDRYLECLVQEGGSVKAGNVPKKD
jgi:hypothetical protein